MPPLSRAIAAGATLRATSDPTARSETFPAGISCGSTIGLSLPHPSACAQITPPPARSSSLRPTAMMFLRPDADTRSAFRIQSFLRGEHLARAGEQLVRFLQDLGRRLHRLLRGSRIGRLQQV